MGLAKDSFTTQTRVRVARYEVQGRFSDKNHEKEDFNTTSEDDCGQISIRDRTCWDMRVPKNERDPDYTWGKTPSSI